MYINMYIHNKIKIPFSIEKNDRDDLSIPFISIIHFFDMNPSTSSQKL